MKYPPKSTHLELFTYDYTIHRKSHKEYSAGQYSYTRHPSETLTEHQGLLLNSSGHSAWGHGWIIQPC